jgi:octaprenyl-diphosphate synthase
LTEVEQVVLASLADLYVPFAQLVQGQWRRNHPLVRAAFVLTAGVSGHTEAAELRRRRVYLAAAMETLRLALGVHTQLLLAESPVDIDRSLLGSTVLAGDFCFSRSAGLAAKTGSSVIVDLFANALQRVSEGSLRRLFRPAEPPHDVDRELCLSGIAAANELAGLAPHEREVDQQIGAHLLGAYRAGVPFHFDAAVGEYAQLAMDRRQKWQALAVWLQVQPPA